MGGVAFFFVIVANLITVILKKKSNMLFFSSIIILALLMGYASTEIGSGDSYWYNLEYYGYSTMVSGREVGFSLITSFFSKMGVSFELYRTILFVVCFALMCFGLREYIQNFNLFILLYSVSLYYFLAVTLNFFISISLIVFSIQFLVKRRFLLYLIIIFIATSFHSAALFAVLFLAILFPNRILFRLLLVLLILDFLLILLMALNTSLISRVAIVYRNIIGLFLSTGSSYLGNYVTVGYSRNSILYIVFFLVNLLFQFLIYRNSKGQLKDKYVDFMRDCLKVSLISSVFLPLMIYTITMIRMLFVSMILCFTSYQFLLFDDTMYCYKIYKNVYLKKKYFIILCYCSVFVWLSFYFRHELSFDFSYYLTTNSLFS